MSETVIACKKLTKSYRDRRVIDGVDVAVERGEILCISGPSGSGKSTLLHMLGLLEEPDSGELVICGQSVPKAGSRSAQKMIQRELNYVMQNYALVENDTVGRNLEFALRHERISKREKNSRIDCALEEVGLAGTKNEKVACLSGGEQQRVALARAMVKSCSILIADEPTGSLDQENRDVVMRLIRHIADSGKAVVLSSHDPVVASLCDRCMALRRLH